MKRELMEHIGTTILNMLNGGHYGMAVTDGNLATARSGRRFTARISSIATPSPTRSPPPTRPPRRFTADALAQGAAEQRAWPYSWFTNANYASAAEPRRGHRPDSSSTTAAIPMPPPPNCGSAWCSSRRPPPVTYDFQQWMKPYQFWTKTDTNGNFTIPNVIAGNELHALCLRPRRGGHIHVAKPNRRQSAVARMICRPRRSPSPSPAARPTISAPSPGRPRASAPTVFEIGYPDRTAASSGTATIGGWATSGPARPLPARSGANGWNIRLIFPTARITSSARAAGRPIGISSNPSSSTAPGNYNNSTSTITFNLAIRSDQRSHGIALSRPVFGLLRGHHRHRQWQ